MLSKLVHQLPPPNRHLLHELLHFLYLVSQHERRNKMNAKNLAIVFAPNILRTEEELNLNQVMILNSVVELMIKYPNRVSPKKRKNKNATTTTFFNLFFFTEEEEEGEGE